jgi:hypothetical protein
MEMWMGIRYCFGGGRVWGDLGKIDERLVGKFEGNLWGNRRKIEAELTRLDKTSEEVVTNLKDGLIEIRWIIH